MSHLFAPLNSLTTTHSLVFSLTRSLTQLHAHSPIHQSGETALDIAKRCRNPTSIVLLQAAQAASGEGGLFLAVRLLDEGSQPFARLSTPVWTRLLGPENYGVLRALARDRLTDATACFVALFQGSGKSPAGGVAPLRRCASAAFRAHNPASQRIVSFLVRRFHACCCRCLLKCNVALSQGASVALL